MITKILKASECGNATARDLCVFLADYSARLLASGATCIRIDKNVKRIAQRYGMEADMTVMPRHIHLTVVDDCTCQIHTSIATVPETGISFDVNTRLSRLSWEIADGKVDFHTAVERYYEVLHDNIQNRWVVLALVALANASFCRLFGGDAVAMAIVGVATLVGFFIKQELAGRHTDVRLVFIICAFVSSVIASTDYVFAIGTTPQIAIGTSVLYLVPGIPFLNSFSDMLYRHYLCAFARFADAVIMTASLSIGLCAGMFIMKIGMF